MSNEELEELLDGLVLRRLDKLRRLKRDSNKQNALA
jgi:hypothetical protein